MSRPSPALRILLCLGLQTTFFSISPARAEAPVKVELGWGDAAWIGGAALASAGALYRYHHMPSVDSGQLNRADLFPFDRWAAGRYSGGAARASDLMVAPFCALPAALTAFEAMRGQTGWDAAAADAVVLAEAYALSSSLNLLVRSLRVHPRPFVYGTEAPREKREAGEASGSWYSGHASAAFLAATYLSYTYPRRHPEFQGEAWLWAGSLGTAATIAALRVAAGRHFPSDVVVGAAAGAAIGWLVPRLHMDLSDGGSVDMRMQGGPSAVYPMLVWRF